MPLCRRCRRCLRLALLLLCHLDLPVVVAPQVVPYLEQLRLHRAADALVLGLGETLGVIEALAQPAQLLLLDGRQVGREPGKGTLDGLSLIGAMLDQQAAHTACECVERRAQQLAGLGRRHRGGARMRPDRIFDLDEQRRLRLG